VAAAAFVLIDLADEVHELGDVGLFLRGPILPAQPRLGRQPIALVQRPHLLGVGRTRLVWRELRVEAVQVFHVAQQEFAGVLILRWVHGLRKVDDDGPVRAEQHVEVREIAVHDASAQHAHHVLDQSLVDGLGLGGSEIDLAEPRRWIPVRITDQLHDEHAVDEVIGRWHAHACRAQPIDHVDLGRAPGGFVLAATVLRALVDGALVAAVANLATLRVVRAMLEGPVVRFLVDLGDTVDSTRDDEIDLRFFAAHQWAHHSFDDALVHQGRKDIGDPHDRLT
jgi:hypothetical protein